MFYRYRSALNDQHLLLALNEQEKDHYRVLNSLPGFCKVSLGRDEEQASSEPTGTWRHF